jgi:hypothetical protein
MIKDAREGRDVATADVAGAYLKADIDDFVIMKFTGSAVDDVLCAMNPSHIRFVEVGKGSQKALCVALTQAVRSWRRIRSVVVQFVSWYIDEVGFCFEPVTTRCIANKTINGKQCTIAWYVDDT